MMDKKASYFLSSLKATEDVVPNLDLSSLTKDFTRFLVKQKEKQLVGAENIGDLKDSYKNIVCLHALWGARDILLNYCLESAIGHLQASEEKYKSELTGGIEDIRQKMFKFSCHFQQKKIHHPKIIAMCAQIEKCLQFKSKSDKRVLIIVKRNFPSFLKVLDEFMSHCSCVRLKIQEDQHVENIISKFNILVIERNYSLYPKNIYFADIDVDEKSCIILYLMKDMADEDKLEPLLKRIVSLSLKYTKCWLLLYNIEKPRKSYPYAGKYVSNLFKLQASLGNYITKHDSFETKILVVCSSEEACSTIRRICDIEMESSLIWNKEDWKDGKWLQENVTKEEKFLLTMPCLNSISSQIILKKMTCRELMTMSKENLIKSVPEIPNRILDILYSIMNSSQGFNSYDKENKISAATATDSTYFKDQENMLRQPSVGKNNREEYQNHLIFNDSKDNRQENTDPSESDIIFHGHINENSNKAEDINLTISDNFPDKSHRIRFGRRQLYSDHSTVQGDVYPNEEDDTQNTDDVLSLNGSQSSIKLNEYEKAEIEGTVNRLTRIEMGDMELPVDIYDVDQQIGYQDDSMIPKYDRTHYGNNMEQFNAGNLCYESLLPPTQQKFLSKDQAAYQSMQTKHGKTIDFENLEYKAELFSENHHKMQKNCQEKTNNIPLHSCIDKQSDVNGKKCDTCSLNNERKSDKIQTEICVPTNFKETSNTSNNSETRNFTRDLTETTRNILRQAYQSPRFGVRPIRPLSQRISVGLAQPLRREKNTKSSTDEELSTRRPNTDNQMSQNNAKVENTTVSQRELETYCRNYQEGKSYCNDYNKNRIKNTRNEFESYDNGSVDTYDCDNVNRHHFHEDRDDISSLQCLGDRNGGKNTECRADSHSKYMYLRENDRFTELENIRKTPSGNHQFQYTADDGVGELYSTHYRGRTPNIRLRMQNNLTESATVDNTNHYRRPFEPRKYSVCNNSQGRTNYIRDWTAYDSPPMDLDYLDDLMRSQQ